MIGPPLRCFRAPLSVEGRGAPFGGCVLVETSSRADRLLAYVREHPGCSFAEIAWAIDGFQAPRGEGGYVVELRPNMGIWFGLTKEWCEAVLSLTDARKIRFRPTSLLVYIAGGWVPQYPVAKQLRDYATMRWVPVVITLGEGAHAE